MFLTKNDKSKFTLIKCNTDNTNENGSGTFIESEKTNPFIVALTFFETKQCANLFVYFPKISKCQTQQQKNIFLHKMISTFFVLLLIKS